MKSFKILPAIVLGLVSFALASTGNSAAQDDDAAEAHSVNPHPLDNSLKIKRPRTGQTVKTKQVAATISLGHNLKTSTLQVLLNGKDVTSKFQQSRCMAKTCELIGHLSTADGVLSGQNRLRASAIGSDNHMELQRVFFDYKHSVLTGGDGGPYLPPSLGISLSPGGAKPWITITTGTPAGLNDQIDKTTYSYPYADFTLPYASDPDCSGSVYQIVAFLRSNPAQNSGENNCVNTSADLKEYVSFFNSDYMVIVATTPGHVATSGLDTTPIGGTNYSSYASGAYPQQYQIIGVGKAPAGTAYEGFYTTSDKPIQYAAFAWGMLTRDMNNLYNFYPGDNRMLQVTPATTAAATSVVVGTQTYGAPANSQNGFWLLILDRVLLQPIDSSNAPGASCPYDTGNTNGCGTFYPTGSSDSGTATKAIADLASAIFAVSPRNLAVLTTVGQPFQDATYVTTDLAQAIVLLGGSRFVLPNLVYWNSNYTIVAPGSTTAQTPFSRKIAVSSSAYSQQGQTGIIAGVLARDQKGLYAPMFASQTDGLQNQGNVITPDFTLYTLASRASTDWPLTDSSEHIAAYHYVSQQFLSNNYNETGSYSQDLRYFYNDTNKQVWTKNTQLNCSSPHSQCPTYPTQTPDPYFSPDDLALANQTLYQELTALNNAEGYLGTGGLRDSINGTNANIALSIISAAYTVENGQFGVNDNTNVAGNASHWLSLLSGVANIGAAGLGVDFPKVGAGIGVLTGGLSIGSAVASWFGNETTPPSYENQFDTTLGNLSNQAQTYQANVLESYDITQDAIYFDPGKLNAVGARVADSNANWAITNLTQDKLESVFGSGVSRSLYLQLLPQFFSLDTYTAQPVDDINKVGMLGLYPGLGRWVCSNSYTPLPPSNGYAIENQFPPSSKHDIFVIGGEISKQGELEVTESMPSQSLLNALFSPNGTPALNFPADPFFSNNQQTGGLLLYREGPNQGHGQCYKPGCSSQDEKECIGP